MLEYIIALSIYVLLLTIISSVFILSSKYLTKKIMKTSIINYNYALIINYIYDIYNEMIEIEKEIEASEAEILHKYMFDIYELIEIMDVSNLDKVIENIKVEQRENNSEEKIHNIPSCIINLFKMKSKLVVMILCHQAEYYNAYNMINNEEKALKKMIKDISKISKKLSDVKTVNKSEGKYDIDDIYKTAEFDVHKNNEENKALIYA